MTTWAVHVDWAKNGHFNDPLDAIWPDVVAVTWRLGLRKPYQSLADESTCQIVLRNHDGKYNPEESASPLAGYLLPQRPVQISANGQSLWRGWTERLEPQWSPASTQTGRTEVVLHCIGAKQFLQEAAVNLPLQQNKRGDQIVAEVLRRVVLPPATFQGWILGKVGFSELGVSTRLARESDYSTLDEGLLTFRYYGDSSAAEQDGYRILKDITEAERGKFFFDRLGKAVWWNRARLLDSSAVVGVVDSTGSAGIRPQALDYHYGASLSNCVRITLYPRQEESGSIVLWNLSKPIALAPGERLQFEAPYQDTTQQAVGALTASLTGATFSTGTATLSLTSQAERGLVALHNTSTAPATLTALQIVGQALTSRQWMVIQADDADSIRAYGRRGELKLNLRALEDLSEAHDIADLELRRRATPRGEVRSFSVLNQADNSANAQQLAWQIGTRLQVRLPELGHQAEYFILGEEHQVSQGGQVHQTTYALEPAVLTRLAHYPRQHYDSEVMLKGVSPNTRLGQRFKVSRTGLVGEVRLWLNKVGNPGGQLTLSLHGNHPQGGTWRLGRVGASELGVSTRLAADSEYPDEASLLGTSQAVALDKLAAAYGWVAFRFTPPVSLTEGVPYWMVLAHLASPDPLQYVQWGTDGTAPTYPDGWMLIERGASWKLDSRCAIFEVYS
jgi:hypothetical protein